MLLNSYYGHLNKVPYICAICIFVFPSLRHATIRLHPNSGISLLAQRPYTSNSKTDIVSYITFLSSCQTVGIIAMTVCVLQLQYL